MFLFWIKGSFAQGTKTDSLIIVLSTTKQDTTKLQILLELSFRLRGLEPHKALEYANNALRLSQKLSQKKQEARAHNNIGLAYFYFSMHDSAIAHYEQSLKIGKTIPDSATISLAYSQLGNTFKAISNLPLSIEYHKKALRIRKNSQDTTLIVQSYSNLGNTYVRNLQYELAMECFFQSLELLKNKKDLPEYTNALGGLGNIYRAQKNYERAIEYYQMCYNSYSLNTDERGMNVTLLNLGAVYGEMGKHDSALIYLKQCIKINERKKKETQQLAEAYAAIADVYSQTDQLYEAKKYLAKAVDIYTELKLNQESAQALFNLSKFFLLSGDKVNGEYYLNEGFKYIKSIKNDDMLSGIYAQAANCYNLTGNPAQAFDYLTKSIRLKDSIETARGVQAIAQMQSAFDFKLKENEIESLNQEKQISNYKISQQQTIIIAMLIGSVLFILLVFFIFRGYKKTREANQALSIANKQINEKSKNISDSINYAKNIQNAILTVPKSFKEQFKDNHFVLYKPKDVVSGDFFWIEFHGRHLLIAVADCTGHGVPGSLMSMLGFEKLKQAVHEKMLLRPHKILSFTNKSFIETFSSNETTGFLRDGMDAALCTLNLATSELLFSGANRPLWIVTTNDKGDRELIVLKATKAAIGGFTEKEQQFDLIKHTVKKDDIIYLFTDGYADQFGGMQNKKFMIKRFRDLILAIASLPMNDQKVRIEEAFNEWKKDNDQVDDVLVIGFKISELVESTD